jgi:glutamate mutase epsilon subunit
MNNNIFVKLNKKKYNPDIETKLNSLENERTQTKFDLNKIIYNPITGIIPQQINSQNDLIIEKETIKSDIKSLVLEKENERQLQNSLFKPIKTKVISNNIDNSNKICLDNSNNDYLKTYNELKNGTQLINNIKVNNYDNILTGLKELGIIK